MVVMMMVMVVVMSKSLGRGGCAAFPGGSRSVEEIYRGQGTARAKSGGSSSSGSFFFWLMAMMMMVMMVVMEMPAPSTAGTQGGRLALGATVLVARLSRSLPVR